jgi:hypothetical protein
MLAFSQKKFKKSPFFLAFVHQNPVFALARKFLLILLLAIKSIFSFSGKPTVGKLGSFRCVAHFN